MECTDLFWPPEWSRREPAHDSDDDVDCYKLSRPPRPLNKLPDDTLRPPSSVKFEQPAWGRGSIHHHWKPGPCMTWIERASALPVPGASGGQWNLWAKNITYVRNGWRWINIVHAKVSICFKNMYTVYSIRCSMYACIHAYRQTSMHPCMHACISMHIIYIYRLHLKIITKLFNMSVFSNFFSGVSPSSPSHVRRPGQPRAGSWWMVWLHPPARWTAGWKKWRWGKMRKVPRFHHDFWLTTAYIKSHDIGCQKWWGFQHH